jgi:hypothetical protein
LFTSCRVVVFAVNSYVAGNRKPSKFGGLPSVRNWGGTLDEPAVSARYRDGESLGSTFRLASAILLTSPIRVAICSRVKPSGKMIRSVFGSGATGFGGGAASSPPPRIAQAEPTRIASTPRTKASATTRRRKIRPCEAFARWRRGGGGVTAVGSSTIPGSS